MSATEIGTERVEALLRGDAARTVDEARYGALLGQLRAVTLQAPDSLRARLAAPATARRRPAAPRSSRRLALVAVAAALGVAVLAAVVHGVSGSGGGTSHEDAAASAKAPLSRPVTSHPERRLRAGSTHVGAFQAATVPTAAGPIAAPLPSGDVGGGSGRLQHTDASVEIQVPDVDRLSHATSIATGIATSLGGYADSVVYRTPAGGGGASYIELRIPAHNVQRALSRLAQLGTLVSQQVSVQDLQHRFEVQSEQVGQLRRRIAALQQALRDPALPDAQRVLLRIRLAESRRALSQRLNARKGTVTSGTTARVSLVLETKKSIVPLAHHHGRLGRMVHSAIGFLGLEATIALYGLIVVGPLALLAAFAWGLTRARRRRDERRLLAA